MPHSTYITDLMATATIDAMAAATIERLEFRNRLQLPETVRPYGTADLGRRIRLFRLPDDNRQCRLNIERRIKLSNSEDKVI